MFALEQIGSHSTDFYEILYWTTFQESVWENSSFIKKSNKNNRYFTWRPMYIYDGIAPNS